MKTKIKLHGRAKHKYGEVFEFCNIHKVVDCLSAIDCNKPGFRNFFTEESKKGREYEFIANSKKVSSYEAAHKIDSIETIEIVPHIKGNDPVSFTIALVINLAIAGITYMMTPTPEMQLGEVPSLNVESTSFLFSTKDNLTSQGIPVPVGYGRLKIGTKVISNKIESNNRESDQRTKPELNSSFGFGGYAYNSGPLFKEPREAIYQARDFKHF